MTVHAMTGSPKDVLPEIGRVSSVERVHAALDLIESVDRPEVWIALAERSALVARAEAIDLRVNSGDTSLPLAGMLVAVKDNIDVAGFPTTAGCPSFAYQPEQSAEVVRRLVDAGALVVGKTNLDQFATGLVGTRSPYGAVRHATRPDHISGGSSSGSAVAVALGIVDVALGTDTAGSGRVPAALHGIIGAKPTRGLVPITGVVPACRSYDTVTVFARDIAMTERALRVVIGAEADDPASRPWAATARIGVGETPRIGIPSDVDLRPLSREARESFHAAIDRVRALGMLTVPVELEPFLRAARLLYEGALVAERCEAAGELVASDADGLDPTVAQIVRRAGTIPAHRLVEDRTLLDQLRQTATAVFDADVVGGIDALLLPTTTEHPTLAAVAADPIGINARMGTYTNFVNLFDLCAVAAPAGMADGSPFGVSFIAPAFADQVVLDLAAAFVGCDPPALLAEPCVDVVVFGAHLRGQPLHPQLLDLGARFSRRVRTAPRYRMVRLPGEPAKPGVQPVATGGASLRGEAWSLTETALVRFLKSLPGPMCLGRIELDDGTHAIGFQCSDATSGDDITSYGGWVEYLANATRSSARPALNSPES